MQTYSKKKIENDRTSTQSWVAGSQINFYHDDEEAQELILDEDRLTYRRPQFEKEYYIEPKNNSKKMTFDKYEKLMKFIIFSLDFIKSQVDGNFQVRFILIADLLLF